VSVLTRCAHRPYFCFHYTYVIYFYFYFYFYFYLSTKDRTSERTV
jgi:hypothetical protein